jgi:hypothetical protein
VTVIFEWLAVAAIALLILAGLAALCVLGYYLGAEMYYAFRRRPLSMDFTCSCPGSDPSFRCTAAATQEDGLCDWCREHGVFHGGSCADCPREFATCHEFIASRTAATEAAP